MPGGPGLPPNVSIGGGPAPIQGMPTPGMGGGKNSPENIWSNTRTLPPEGDVSDPTKYQQYGDMMFGGGQPDYYTGGPAMTFGQSNPMPPSMYSQPQPNFANALGTQSPFLNSVQR
jgi:hypothetical protein